MNKLFKNELVVDNISKIIKDSSFTVKKYGFRKIYLKNLLTKTSKLQFKTAKNILLMYNDYLQSNLGITDIFNTEFLLNYTTNHYIEFEFNKNEKEAREYAFKFIEHILSIDLKD